MSLLLWACFVLSGAAALAAEMLWIRSAGLVLGQTADTAATVLACYFAGMAIGAAAGRRALDRPVRRYVGLEAGAACGILWSMLAFHWLDDHLVLLSSSTVGGIVRLAAVAVAVTPATLFFGATLPVLAQALAPGGARSRRTGLLYACNIAGGVIGALVMGLGLPAMIGVRGSYLAVAALSAAAAAAALLVVRQAPAGGGVTVAQDTVSIDATNSASLARLRTVAAGVGALGLGLEVLWTRLFAQVLHNSTYSFAAIAVTFLCALAAGAALAALLLPRVGPARVAVSGLLSCSVLTVAGGWLFVLCTGGLDYVGMHTGLDEYLVRVVALVAITAGPAAMASGAVLPALWAMWREAGSVARPVGDLSAANLFGGAAGALVAGFAGMPLLGVRGSMLAVAIVYPILADALALRRGGAWRIAGYAALLLAAVADPFRQPLIHLRDGNETVLEVTEGRSGIVSVVEEDGDRQLRLDNTYTLGGSAAAVHERRLGVVPLLLHPSPRSVFFIGCATGISASGALALGVERITIAELVPEVVAAARTRFGTWNGHVLDRPETEVLFDDGRHSLAATERRFDVIIGDLFIPWHAGASSLYSKEMFQLAASRLSEGGLFCQWLPLYQMTRDEFNLIARTFLSVFPQVRLWRADFFPNRPVCGLTGCREARGIDPERACRRAAAMPQWAADPQLAAAGGFVMLYAGNLTTAADLFGDGPLNTDDRPRIEFLAPRLTRLQAGYDKDWFAGAALASFFRELDGRGEAKADPTLPSSKEVVDARRAGTALFEYAVAATSHDAATAKRLQAEVQSLVPDLIAKSDELSAAAGLPALRAEQKELRLRIDAMQRQLDGMRDQDHR